MKKGFIKKLAEESFTNKNLDKKKTDRISVKLSRQDLKQYVKDLKNIENRRTVIVTVPSDNGASKIRDMFAKIYPAKRIIVNVDESLIGGIKVVDFDNEYELSLKSFLENSMEYVKKND